MFLKKLMTGKDSRKGGRAMRVWKRLCVLAVLLCACGVAWGQTYSYSFFRWEGTLGDPSATVYLHEVSSTTSLSINQVIEIIGNTSSSSTYWEGPLDLTATSLYNRLTSASLSDTVYIFPRHESANIQIGDFTLPANVELSTYIGDTVTVTGNLEISGTVNTHCAFVFDSTSVVTIKDDAVFNLDDGNGSITSAGKIIIEADGNSNGTAGTFNAKSGKLTNTGTIENAGSFANSATFTNSGTVKNVSDAEFINDGEITNDGDIENSGTITNNNFIENNGAIDNSSGTINTSTGDFQGTLPDGGTVNVGNKYVITGGKWNDTDTSNWLGGKKPPLDSSEDVTIVLLNDVLVEKDLDITSSKKYTINLNGNTLKLAAGKTLNLKNNGIVLDINGSGTVSMDKFDTDDNATTFVNLSSRVDFYIKETFFGNLSNSNRLTFTNYDGTSNLYIPASGANVNYGTNKVDYLPDGFIPKPYGEPEVYKMESITNGFPGTNGRIILEKSAAGNDIDLIYKYKVEIEGSSATYKIKGDIKSNGDTGEFKAKVQEDTALDIPVSAEGTINKGEGIIITVFTPDDSGMVLGEFRYIQDEIKWVGGTTGSENDWGTASNWSNNSVPSDSDTVVIPSSCRNYPIIESAVEVGKITIKNNANLRLKSGSLTVETLETEGTGFINYDYGATPDSGTLIFKGEKATWKSETPIASKILNVKISNDAVFQPQSDLYIVGTLDNSGTGTYDSTVYKVQTIFEPLDNSTAYVKGNTFEKSRFCILSCINHAGETINFSGNIYVKDLILSGTANTEGNRLIVAGDGKINLASSQYSGRFLDLNTENVPSITNKDGNVIPALTFTVYNSLGTISWDTLSNKGWRQGPADVYVWQGVNTDWNNRINWNKNSTPSANSRVLIPSGVGSYPKIKNNIDLGGEGVVLIENGAEINLDKWAITAGTITVGGKVSLDGVQTTSSATPPAPISPLNASVELSFENTCTIEYTGSESTLILDIDDTTTEKEFYNLILSGDGKTITDDIVVSGNAEIYNDNTFNNITFTGAGKTLKFESGKTQTVTGKITIKGEDGNLINIDSTDGENRWILDVPANSANVDVSYASVRNSESLNSLVPLRLWENNCENGSNTKRWFKGNIFTWIGATSSSWENDYNWENEDGDNIYPDKTDIYAEIIINADGVGIGSTTHTLKLDSDISVKSIVVNDDITVDFANYEVTVDDSSVGITNNGTIKLSGAKSINGTKINGYDSSIEYYGNCATLPWGNEYVNLIFSNGANGTVTDTITVSKDLTLDAGSEKTITLKSTSNQFGGDVTIKSGSASLYGTFTKIKVTDDIENLSLYPSSLYPSSDLTLYTTNDKKMKSLYVEATLKTLAVDGKLTTGDLTNKAIITGSDDVTITGTFDDSAGTWNHTGIIIFDKPSSGNPKFVTKDTKTYPLMMVKNSAELEVENKLLVVSATVNGTIKSNNDQTYKKSVTLTGDATFVAVDNPASPTAPKTITFGAEATTPGDPSTPGFISTGSTDTYKLKITGNAKIYGENTFKDITIDNSSIAAPTTVTFEADKLQTITDCLFKGCEKDSEIYPLTLTTTDISATPTEWKVYFTKTPSNADYGDFYFVIVDKSISVMGDGSTDNKLELAQSGNHASDPEGTTENWFKEAIYYWIGGVSLNWADAGNWKYDVNDISTVTKAPSKTGSAQIVISTGSGCNDLDLDDGIGIDSLKVKYILIESGKRIDIGKCTIEATESEIDDSDPLVPIIVSYGVMNYGTICLDGSNSTPFSDGTTPSGSTVTTVYHSNGTDIDGTTNDIYSTIEYDTNVTTFPLYYEYDDTTDPSNPVTKFVNLSFAEGASCELEACIEVFGTTTIKAGVNDTTTPATPNPISLKNTKNKFTGEVIIGESTTSGGVTKIKSGGAVNIVSSDEVTIKSNVYCDTLELNAEVNFDEATAGTALEINATKTTFHKNVKSKSLTAKTDIEIANSISLTNSGLFTTVADKTIKVTEGKSFTQNGTGNVVLGGSLTTIGDTTEISFASDVLATSATSAVIFGGGSKEISFAKNLIINYSADTISNTFASPIKVGENFVLYSGEVKVNKDLTVTGGDIILLGKDYKITDAKTGNTNYVYNQYRGTSSASIARNYTATKLPDGVTDVPSLATEFVSLSPPANVVPFHGKFTAGSGVTIKAGKNFYANGLEISGANEWNLLISKNYNASSFAEAYNCNVKNVNADCNNYVSGTDPDPAEGNILAKVNAYECTDGSGNTNWDFDNFEIISANSTSDNTVKVEFSSPVRFLSTTSEDLCDNDSVKYSGAAYKFTNVEADAENENIIYFKTTVSDNWWKTDATGLNGGKSISTDSLGNYHNNQPNSQPVTTDLHFARDLNSLADKKNAAVLTTKWGKRIENYVSSPYTNVTDGASPVIIKVHTGQETHTNYTGTPESQPSYDAHNFIELVYSEPVDLFSDDGTTVLVSAYDSGNPAEPNLFENTRVTNSLGKIENSGNGILISGIAKIAAGRLQTGASGTADGTVNAFYRKSGMNTHTIRISIAGCTDGTVTDNDGNEYKKWIGYIDNAATPSGAVTMPAGNCPQVKDQAGNLCSVTKPGLVVSSPANPTLNDYGEWDVRKPSFAVYRRAKKAWSKDDLPESEAVGSTIDGTSSLKRIEFHLFDNEPEFNNSEKYQWVSRQGWVEPFTPSKDVIPELYEKDYSYAADVFGGARPFNVPKRDDFSRTSGGIRYCSIAESAGAFKYVENINGVPNKEFDSSVKAFAGAASPVFQSITSPSRNATGSDGLYFGLNFAETILSLRTHFLISYDSSAGYITDLAGNRLGNGTETITIRTKDLTPPSFNLTVAPVGQNKLYVMFNKALNVEKVKLLDENDIRTEKDALTNAYPNAFGLYELSADSNLPVEADITIDKNEPAKVLYKNDDYMGLEFTLTRNVTFDDIRKLYLVAKPESKQYKDPVIDVPTEFTTFIQDDDENYMAAYSAHALSDFAVDVINPLYAYNESFDDGNEKVQINLFGDGSNAVHDWNEDQQNFGTLLTGDEIHIISSVKLSSDSKVKFKSGDFNVRIYLDKSPNPESVSVEYNRATPEFYDWRIWLPELEGFETYKVLADKDNDSVEYITDGVSGGSYDFDFVLPKDVVSETWQNGDQVTFMFGLNDKDNSPLTVVHNPIYDYSTKKYSLDDKFPVFALRTKVPGDLTSLDLWSFKLKDQKLQRGGVTILNNVIDAGVGEKVAIKIDNPTSGKVDVIVMTLDGNVIEYLNRGNLDSGSHYFTWNGRNRSGKAVARGMYFVRVVGNGFDETRKVMVVK